MKNNYLQRSLSFLLICFFCMFFLYAIALIQNSGVFWSVLNKQFDKDERFQVQGLFLPRRNFSNQRLYIGDQIFLSAIPDAVRKGSESKEIVISAYDSDDLKIVMEGLQYGMNQSQSSICSIVLQVSPLFSLRAKAVGDSQNLELLKTLEVDSMQVHKRIALFLKSIENWAGVRKSVNYGKSIAYRHPKMVGQATIADASSENWNNAFSKISSFKGSILAILDIRGTDWGESEGGDLINKTEEKLSLLAVKYSNFSWIYLDQLKDSDSKFLESFNKECDH